MRPTALNCFPKRELDKGKSIIIYERIVVRVVGHYGVHGLGEKLIVANSGGGDTFAWKLICP